jgi:hypothetical protein
MSLLSLGTTACFICGRAIALRVEAAQLEYASPDDVGEIARRGRAWVHRQCWTTWPMRSQWAASTRRLMNGAAATAVRDVATRPSTGGVLLTDARAALSITIPREQIANLRTALRDGGTVLLGHASWVFAPKGKKVHLTAFHERECFEDLDIDDPDAWDEALTEG